MARIAHPDRIRHGNYTPLKRDGQWVCVDCGAAINATMCGRNVRPSLRCYPCARFNHHYRAILSGKGIASNAIKQAKKRGEIPEATGQACTDCGRPADCYDHRDYNKPLSVEPVCRSCNVMRGPAIPFNPLLVGLLLAARLASA